MKLIVITAGLLLASCAHLKSPFVSFLPQSKVEVLELQSLQLTSPSIHKNIGSFTFESRQVKSFQPWQWRGRFSVGAGQQSFISPIFLGGDQVLVSTVGGGLSLWNLRSGHAIWRKDIELGLASHPLVLGGSVYFAGLDAKVYKLRLSNGDLEWVRSISAESLGGMSGAGGLLFLSSADDTLWALDEKTGNILWSYKRPKQDSNVLWSLRGQSVPLLSPDARTVFIGFSDGVFVALEASSGETIWERSFKRAGRFLDADLTPSISSKGDRLYIALVDGDLLAVNTTNGQTLWTYAAMASSAAAFDENEGSLYLVNNTGNLMKFSSENGVLMWSVPLPGNGLGATPEILGSNTIAVINANFGLSFHSRSNGNLLSEKRLGQGFVASPSFDGQRLLVLSPRNQLFVYSVEGRGSPL